MKFAVDQITITGDQISAQLGSPSVASPVPTVKRKRRRSRNGMTTTQRREIKARMKSFGAKHAPGRYGKVLALAKELGMHYTSLYKVENGK